MKSKSEMRRLKLQRALSLEEEVEHEIRELYHGILSPEIVDGCVKWWVDKVKKVKNNCMKDSLELQLEAKRALLEENKRLNLENEKLKDKLKKNKI